MFAWPSILNTGPKSVQVPDPVLTYVLDKTSKRVNLFFLFCLLYWGVQEVIFRTELHEENILVFGV